MSGRWHEETGVLLSSLLFEDERVVAKRGHTRRDTMRRFVAVVRVQRRGPLKRLSTTGTRLRGAVQ